MDGNCSMHEGDEICIQNFYRETWTGDKTWENWRRCEHNTKIDKRKIGCSGAEWTHSEFKTKDGKLLDYQHNC
jgi:hypothetical protein